MATDVHPLSDIRAPSTRLSTMRSLKGIGPFQFGESREVPIRGHERTPMLYGERRQMRIRHKIAERLSLDETALQHGPVPLGRRDDSRARLIQPALHATDRLI